MRGTAIADEAAIGSPNSKKGGKGTGLLNASNRKGQRMTLRNKLPCGC